MLRVGDGGRGRGGGGGGGKRGGGLAGCGCVEVSVVWDSPWVVGAQAGTVLSL